MVTGSIWVNIKLVDNGEVTFSEIPEQKPGDILTSSPNTNNSSQIIFGEKSVNYNR